MSNIADIVRDFTSQESFRNQWGFPDEENVYIIKSIINRTDKGKLASCNTTSRIRKNYRILIESGVEWIISKDNKKILTQERFPEEFIKAHNATGHPGRMVTISKMKETFLDVPYRLVYNCIAKCENCCSRKPLAKPVAGKPIYASGTMDRIQIDLIDMRSHSDGEFKWIAHAKDHFSKFTWAEPLTNKTCALVTKFVRRIFFTFGPPKILQCDNGGEFTGSELSSFLKQFYPSVKLIHSRARHPQTNGLIERANSTLESRLSAYMQDNGDNWSSHLDFLISQINTSLSRVIKATPHELMFAKKANNGSDVSLVPDKSDSNSLDDADSSESDTDPDDSPPLDLSTSVDSDNNAADNFKGHLLYDIVPPFSWAIAKLIQKSDVTSEFELKMILCPELCPVVDNERLLEGQVVSWPNNRASDSLGETVQAIMARVPSWNSYLQDRKSQGEHYNKKLKVHRYEIGQLVSLPIPRVDRSNTCPKNLACKIVNINEGILTLQCSVGTIETGIHEDKVGQWLANDLHTDGWECIPVSLIKAYRSATAYSRTTGSGSSICKCKPGNACCVTKRCPCNKSGIGCGTKCHPKNSCSNPHK